MSTPEKLGGPASPGGEDVPGTDPGDPSTYQRRVLLLVTGLSPQIVTETVYALTQRAEAPFVPTEIRVLTTREGRERARLTLLSEQPGWFHRLRRDYTLPDIRFTVDDIEVVGGVLDDIRSPADNELAADAITRAVRGLTADAGSALHVSMAGGRKTMGFYAGYALSIFGRPQDRLSHVLVSSPFEGLPEFFYPTPGSQVIYTGGDRGRPLDARDAEVNLAEIPFFSLRGDLPRQLLEGEGTFRDAVDAARLALSPPELVLDLQGRSVRASGKTVSLTPDSLAMLALFARRAVAGKGALHPPPKGVPDRDWAQLFLAERQRMAGALEDIDRQTASLARGMDGDVFSMKVSRLHKALRDQLGDAARHYLVSHPGRPRRCQLDLPPTAIHFSDDS